MASLTEYRCEICGTVRDHPLHWFIIRCNNDELTVLKWNSDVATEEGARHLCGEAHAQVYISRWLESACSPAKSDYTSASSAR